MVSSPIPGLIVFEGPIGSGDSTMNTDEESLKRWMCAIADGDTRSLRALFEATRAYVHGLVRSILGSSDAVEDVIVDTYVRVWKGAKSYDASRGTVGNWIGTFARNRAIDHLRALGRDRTESADPDDLLRLTALEPCPLESSLEGERAGHVRNAVEALGDDQRQVVEAVFFRGLTHVQAAEHLGEPLGTVKGRVRAAMNTLRQNLGLLEEGAI